MVPALQTRYLHTVDVKSNVHTEYVKLNVQYLLIYTPLDGPYSAPRLTELLISSERSAGWCGR